MVHQLILLLAIASSLLHIVSSILRCTGPSSVTLNSTDFTITGPCPNTVIAPVGSTVQYTCEYVDNSPLIYTSYWHIAELSGTPFLKRDGGDHNLTIMSVFSAIGSTNISILVKEQYLNNTLTIQCGLCSVPEGCNTSDSRLSENIISSVVQLVSFG